MRETITYCDACGKDITREEPTEVRIPVRVGKTVATYKLELCGECCGRFADLYTQIKEENGEGIA